MSARLYSCICLTNRSDFILRQFIEHSHDYLFQLRTKDCEESGQQITAHLSRPKWVFHHGWRRRTMVSPILQITTQWKQITGPGPTCRMCPSGGTRRLSQTQRESERTVNLTPLWLCSNVGHETDAKKRIGVVSVNYTRKRWHFILFN